MKKIVLLLVMFLVVCNVSAQKLKGNKVVTIEDREVEFFNKILKSILLLLPIRK